MKLTVLADNNTYIDKYYLGEPGVSYYIEDGDAKILFDVGYSDVYMQNAAALGIELSQIDTLVFSHGHNDHTGGMVYFPDSDRRIRLIAHPAVFNKKLYEGLDAGAVFSKDEMAEMFDLRLSDTPVAVSENITFLGHIPRTDDFENKMPVGECLCGDTYEPDFLYDDSALVFRGKDGIYIITGCSHSGICNIIEYAKYVTGVDTVLGVIGGFHLLQPQSEQLARTVEYLAGEKIANLYPCHCTCFAARAAINAVSPVREVGVSLTLEWE